MLLNLRVQNSVCPLHGSPFVARGRARADVEALALDESMVKGGLIVPMSNLVDGDLGDDAAVVLDCATELDVPSKEVEP